MQPVVFTWTLARPAMHWYSRYTLLCRPPPRLRFRNGTVLLEIIRDCGQAIPTWVFRARRATSPRVAYPPGDGLPMPRVYQVDTLTGSRLPTVSPANRAASCVPAVIIASSAYGHRALEQALRDGVVLEDGSPAARVMDALVKLGHAARGRASARDL